MKKTFPEKLNEWLKKACKQHPKCKKLYQMYVSVVMFFYHFGMHFALNGKRYMCMGVFVLFFAANSSFAFYGSDIVNAEPVEESDITLAEEVEVDQDSIEILDEEDALNDFIDVEYHSADASEQYTLDDLLEEHEQYLNASGEKEKVVPGEVEELEFSADDWKLVLVNKQHPIPDDYTFELEVIKDGMQCYKRIMEDLLTMMSEAREQGINLAIRSPYRTMDRQIYLFNRKVNLYMGQGMSYMDAYKTTAEYVTVPGASEHQIGLALDITSDTYYTLDEGFEDTAEGKWLAEHSHEYGFILRYPKGKEYITSIGYEPWHFRYVGVEAATVIWENDLTLEEFWDEYVY